METIIKQKSSPTKNPSTLVEVYQVHQQLLKTIQEMDVKIDEVIKQHEAEFLLAYRNHIKTMKQQLTSIKQKAEEQQKKMLSNDRAVYLQKQLILFREQALKLYDKLEEKTQECQHQKSQVKEYERVKNIVEKQNRELLKINKSLQAQIAIQQNRNAQVSKQINHLRTQLQSNKETIRQISKGQTINTFNFTQNIRNTPKSKDLFNISIQSKKHSKVASIKPQTQIEGSRLGSKVKKMSQDWMDHELKNWFLECIETIRKQVAQRKFYGYKSEDLNGISSWEQFRMIDKLRLLEMFMQNEKLLVWMYQKIFPTRLNEIQSYLASKPSIKFDSRQKSKSANISADDLLLQFPKNDKDATQILMDDLSNEHILPKVLPLTKKKSMKKKYDIRQRIDIKNGKLNFSSIQNDV